MAQDSGRLNSILENLRGMLRGEIQERLFGNVQEMVDEFAAMRKRDEEAWRTVCPKMAVRLYCALSRTADPVLGAICFKGLARLNAFGQMLAAMVLIEGHIAPKEAGVCLDELDMTSRLGVLDALLRRPETLSDEIRSFALGLVCRCGMETDAGLTFLRETARYDCGCSLAVGASLLGGDCGRHCLNTLAKPDNAELLLDMAELVAQLHIPDVANHLLPHLSDASPAMIARFIDLMSQSKLSRDAIKHLASMLLAKDTAVAVSALDALIRIKASNIVPLAASIHLKIPALRKILPTRLPLLSRDEFRGVLRRLPDAERRTLFVDVFQALAQADPTAMQLCIDLCASVPDDPGRDNALATLRSLLGESPLLELEEPRTPKPKGKSKAEEPEQDKKGGLKGLFGKKAKKDDGGGGMLVDFAATSASQDADSGQETRDEVFEDRTFESSTKRRNFYIGATFRNCTFSNSVLEQSVFLDCVFENTTFDHCDLTGTQWFRCALRDCTFAASMLDGAVFHEAWITRTRMRHGSAQGMILSSTTLLSSRLEGICLDKSTFQGVHLRGVELFAIQAQDVTFRHLAGNNVTVSGLLMARCTAVDIMLPHPVFQRLEEDTLRARLQEVRLTDKPGMSGGSTERLAIEATDHWFARRDAQRKASTFMEQNIRRQEWGMEKMGQDKSSFYRVLPLLLATRVFDRAMQLDPATPICAIAGYDPDPTALGIAKALFPDFQPPDAADDGEPPSENGKPIPTIVGLYTIGSLGTLAQGADSDLDYWVCHDNRGLDGDAMPLLRAKLEKLTDWADSRFGLEAYFFLMDIVDVRQNNFGFSDKESSGSAQALLLKEEFYRTAVMSTGSPPVWWFAPPSADPKIYTQTMIRLSRMLGGQFALHMGHMEKIPDEEFFGASLWQIVKGLKSPFKSIMKFGLLEFYTSESTKRDALLCDRVKMNIQSGKKELWDVDPYVALYREVTDYYRAIKQEGDVGLITMAFSLKAGLQNHAGSTVIPLRREHAEIRAVARRAAAAAKGQAGHAVLANLTFHKLLKIGNQVNKFMVRTYVNVRDKEVQGTSAAITPEDLTKLGRKIATFFSRKDNKIERIPILKMKHDFFSELHLLVTFPHNVRTWHLQGGHLNPDTGRIATTDLKVGPDLAPILAWAAANHMYAPGMVIKADRMAHPIINEDLRHALEVLSGFFSEKSTFDTDIEESLKPETITRVMVLLNMSEARENNALKEAAVLYSTNWGELFHMELPAEGRMLFDNPMGFLSDNLPLPIGKHAVIKHYAPAKSRCPKLPVL